jgi:PKD domain
MKLKNLCVITMIVSSLFLIATFSVEAETITDEVGDVSSVDYFTGETNIVTSSPDINIDNLDLIKATYTQQGTQATLSVQVKGYIENRGTIMDLYSEDVPDVLDSAEYDFQLTTSEQDYSVSYSNETGQLAYGDEQINLTSSDFSVVDNTLTISFELTSADEAYSDLSVTSTYIKADLSTIDSLGMVYLSDVAPNSPLVIDEAYASNIGSVGENIQFNASLEPFTGQPPYIYHWDFGDQSSSTQLNPTHTYTKAGVYTYTFMVTDNADATTNQSGTITISSAEGDGGGEAKKDSLSTQMILFFAILLIIIVIGVVVIVWIIRR